MNDKITDKHLERAAYFYIRQSTLQQVRHNQESSRRQYALQDRARDLGFETVVIDDDLGISGAGTEQRPGFSKLLAAVCNGEVGGVFTLEASRLARNNRDWHHLIDLCVLTQTVVVDDDGVYDPRLLNDRLLLGLKGTRRRTEPRHTTAAARRLRTTTEAVSRFWQPFPTRPGPAIRGKLHERHAAVALVHSSHHRPPSFT